MTTLALILSGLVKIPIPRFRDYFPFLGTTLIVTATWIMYHTENKNLSELGFDLKKRNLSFLPIGLILGIIAFVFGFHLTTYITGEKWNLNRNIQYANILRQLYWILPTAVVQEFLVRGYCFKKLIEMSNQTVGIVVFGLVFIAMHDFWNGNLFNIILYSLTLFLGHLLFSEALLRSGTIYFSIGLHWGNNLANGVLFTDGQRDTSLLFTTNQLTGSIGWTTYVLIFLAANMGFLLLTYIIWKWRPRWQRL